MQFNTIFNIDLISNPELYEKIKSCQSEEELLTTLGRDHKDLLFVLEHLPIINASNHTFIAKVISLTTEEDRNAWSSDTLARLEEAEKALLDCRLDDELTETIKTSFSEFQSVPIPNIYRLTYKLQEAVINIALQHSKSRPIKETLEKADRLIEQTARE
ncbi:MAG: hypothetical protein ACE5GN_03580, partial [Waddliaceae bacterium]